MPYGKINCELLEVCTSTNDVLIEKAKNGAEEGTTVISKSQTGGKGTKGRSFYSPKNGIYMSVLLKGVQSENLLDITPFAAVAVSEVLDRVCLVKTQIKPINDIYLKRKKVCGILTQAESCGKNVNFVVVGIGINLVKPFGGFTEELQSIAGYILEKEDEKKRKKIITEICETLLEGAHRLADEKFRKNMYSIYNEKIYTPV